jgi:hypothetical protein
MLQPLTKACPYEYDAVAGNTLVPVGRHTELDGSGICLPVLAPRANLTAGWRSRQPGVRSTIENTPLQPGREQTVADVPQTHRGYYLQMTPYSAKNPEKRPVFETKRGTSRKILVPTLPRGNGPPLRSVLQADPGC